MEDHYLSFSSIILIFLFIIFLTLKVSKRFKDKGRASNLPPGPWKLPIFGSIHHLGGSLPHYRMRELSQKYGPLMHLQLGETSVIVISSPEIAKEVFKTNGVTFANRPRLLGGEIVSYGCTSIAFAPYGDYWRQLRKICQMELLSTRRVRSFQSIREEEVSSLVRDISMNTGSPINLTDKIVSLITRIVSRATFGDICKEDQVAYGSFVKEMMTFTEVLRISNLFPSQRWLAVISGITDKLEKIHRTGDALLENLINSATAKIGEDASFVSILLTMQDHDEFRLTINNIKATIQDIYIGGVDTSSTALEWAFSALLRNPRVMKKAQAEVRQVFGNKGYVDETAQDLRYLKAVIKETLRFHPPHPLLVPRECVETCEISGYTIPAGTQVLVNIWAIGRDPKYWNKGDEFYPERFLDCPIDYMGSNFEFIPFGAGKRICPGILFAPPNLELPLAQLLYYFDWKLPNGTSPENLDMTEAFGTSVRRKNDLFAIPIPYL